MIILADSKSWTELIPEIPEFGFYVLVGMIVFVSILILFIGIFYNRKIKIAWWELGHNENFEIEKRVILLETQISKFDEILIDLAKILPEKSVQREVAKSLADRYKSIRENYICWYEVYIFLHENESNLVKKSLKKFSVNNFQKFKSRRTEKKQLEKFCHCILAYIKEKFQKYEQLDTEELRNRLTIQNSYSHDIHFCYEPMIDVLRQEIKNNLDNGKIKIQLKSVQLIDESLLAIKENLSLILP